MYVTIKLPKSPPSCSKSPYLPAPASCKISVHFLAADLQGNIGGLMRKEDRLREKRGLSKAWM